MRFALTYALNFQFGTNILTVLDTSQIAKEIWNGRVGSLDRLLGVLGCPHNRLHCAGNDANFTLKALLLLAAMGFDKRPGKNTWQVFCGELGDKRYRIGRTRRLAHQRKVMYKEKEPEVSHKK
jgi:DNA polymerase III epsilon subunit-like protein